MERRKFVKTGTTAGMSVFLMLERGLADRKSSLEIPVHDDDAEVIDRLSHYSHRIYLTGGILAHTSTPDVSSARQRVVDLLTCVDDFGALTGDPGLATLARNYSPVISRGSSVHFSVGTTFYRVENVFPDQFEARLEAITSGENSRLTFKALCYDPSKRVIWDKFGVLSDGGTDPSRKITPQNKSRLSPSSLEDVITGRTACYYHRMTESSAFQDFSGLTLDLAAESPEAASEVVELLLQHIATLAEAESHARVRDLLESRLVTTAFALRDGRSASAMAHSFAAVQRVFGDRHSLPEMWLAILIGSANEQWGNAHLSFLSGDGHAAAKTLEALPGALEILRSPEAPSTLSFRESTFENWAADAQLAQTADEADPDGDGLPNLIEYGLGMDPNLPSVTGLPNLSSESVDGTNFLTLRYRKDLTKTDIHYQVETCTDLHTDWTTEGVVDEAEGPPSGDHLEWRRARVPTGDRERYLRLHIRRR